MNLTAVLADLRAVRDETRAQRDMCRWSWGCDNPTEPDEVLCGVHLELDRAPDVLGPTPTVWTAAR